MDIIHYVLFVAVYFSIFLKQSIAIVGGKEVEPHAIPYQALLFFTDKDGNLGICGGSLITRNYVLTAARYLSGVSSVQITLGAHNITNMETTQVQMQSKNFTIHPQFTTNVPNFVYVSDIAVVALPEPVELNDYIQTVRLPPPAYASKYVNRTGRISGWGLTDGYRNSSYSAVLLAQEHKIISNEECTKTYFDLQSYDICMDTNGTDSPCQGDYGSPLTIKDDIDIQVGIASQNIEYCIPGYPVLYTRVSDFLSWIEEVTDYKQEDYSTSSSPSEIDTTTIGVSSTTSEITDSDSTTEWIRTTTSGACCICFCSVYFLVGLILVNISNVSNIFY